MCSSFCLQPLDADVAPCCEDEPPRRGSFLSVHISPAETKINERERERMLSRTFNWTSLNNTQTFEF